MLHLKTKHNITHIYNHKITIYCEIIDLETVIYNNKKINLICAYNDLIVNSFEGVDTFQVYKFIFVQVG